MMINIISVGKVKQPATVALINDYAARIKHYTPLKLIEIKEQAKREKETEAILNHLQGFVIVLDEQGKQFSSSALSEFLKHKINNSIEITVVIGNYYGVDKKVKEKAQLILSFSSLTFPHDIAKLLLLEQLYRSFTIIKGLPYHKY